MTIVNVTNIKSVFTSAIANCNDQEERDILSYYDSALHELLQSFRSMALKYERDLDTLLSMPHSTSYQTPVLSTGRPGRPRFNISSDQLQYLSSMSFTWADIASMFGVSRMTIYRRRLEYGLLHHGVEIEDRMLISLLQEMRVDFPDMGEVLVLGRLRALGYRVT